MGKPSGSEIQVTEYRMSIHFGVCLAPGVILKKIYVGEKLAWTGSVSDQEAIAISKPDLFGGNKKEGGVSGLAYYLPGETDQVVPAELAARFETGLTSANCPAFRGLTTIVFIGGFGSTGRNVDLGGFTITPDGSGGGTGVTPSPGTVIRYPDGTSEVV